MSVRLSRLSNTLLKRLKTYRPLGRTDIGCPANTDCRALTWGVGLLTVVVMMGGCRGRAQEDLYRQTLQREVRELEDQLYEADYENRILIDKLRRERAAKPASTDCPEPNHVDLKPARPIPPPILDPGYVPVESQYFDMGAGFDDVPTDDAFESRGGEPDKAKASPAQPLRDPQTETIPPGTPSRPSEQIPRPRADSKTDRGDQFDDLPDMDSLVDPGTLVDPGELVDPAQLQRPIPTPKNGSVTPKGGNGFNLPGSNELLPPPGGPTPPGTPDLKFDPIEPGVPVPPNSPNGRPDGPPGKIRLDGLSLLGGLGQVAGSTPKIELQATKMRIDATLSVVRMATETTASTPAVATEGVDVVLRTDDQYGHPISVLGRIHDPIDPLRSPNTAIPRPLPKQTTLTIVALDPTKTGDDAQLGRWDFTTDQIRELETSSLANQASGYAITVPIRWREQRPMGEAVVFFARLQTAERDLRCESEIGLKKQPSVAGWLPRK